uniref:Uncharacterized protein n=1 Tax=Amblyomma parvum TaxID=251391 RepID=A0A023G042_AMBPA
MVQFFFFSLPFAGLVAAIHTLFALTLQFLNNGASCVYICMYVYISLVCVCVSSSRVALQTPLCPQSFPLLPVIVTLRRRVGGRFRDGRCGGNIRVRQLKLKLLPVAKVFSTR